MKVMQTNFIVFFSLADMAVIVKDVKVFPKDTPNCLLLDKHINFLADYGVGETQYEFSEIVSVFI